jgi:hypothetical protein
MIYFFLEKESFVASQKRNSFVFDFSRKVFTPARGKQKLIFLKKIFSVFFSKLKEHF